uniref:HNH endonuclease n=1 Tax=Panagrolaimus davidi TaxID=227884 RepID=A0A914R014_9BILA
MGNQAVKHDVDRSQKVRETKDGYVPNIIRYSDGRIRYAFGQVDINSEIGTGAQENVRFALKGHYLPGDEAFHIIPKSWGGSGHHVENFYAGPLNMNRGMDKQMDVALANFDRVQFSIEFFYTGNNKRPDRFSYIRTVYKKENGNYIERATETGTDENFSNELSQTVKSEDL